MAQSAEAAGSLPLDPVAAPAARSSAVTEVETGAKAGAGTQPITAVLEPPAEWGVGADVPAEVFADLEPSALLDELEKHERLTAWLVARGVAIVEHLARTREAEAVERLEIEDPHASSRRRTLARTEARACIEDEVALATGLSFGVARARTTLALGETERATPVRAALARGELSWHRAWHVTGATQDVPAAAIETIVAKLVAPYPARSVHGVGGLLVPQQIFTSRLRYQLAKVLTRAEQHESNLASRAVTTTVDAEFGTGALTVSGHAARVTGAHERVDGIARNLRRGGDKRTLNQLRSDIALDLILYGQIPAVAPDLLGTAGGTTAREAGSSVGAGSSAGAASFDPALFGGVLPPARVDVVVPLSVLIGASDEPGMVTCGDEQHWLAAAFVRDIAFAAGSTWRRLVTDPVTGHLRDLSFPGYQVTGELRERIFARDRISRAPGRTRPARLCDTDHDIDHHLGGPTSESNVSAKDRRGHNHKTRRTWHSERAPGTDGEIVWTTPTGRRYATQPWSYLEDDPTSATSSCPDESAEHFDLPDVEHIEPMEHVEQLRLPGDDVPPLVPRQQPQRIDGLRSRGSRFEDHLTLLIADHHTPGVITRRPKRRRPAAHPDESRGRQEQRGQHGRGGWSRTDDPGPPPF